MLTAEIAGGVSPTTQALFAFIERSAEQVGQRAAGGAKPSDSLLYTGVQQVSVPAALLDDPMLSMPAKLLWIQMQRHAAERGGTAFPTYREAARMLGTSEPTLANAITQLRILRWISVCRGVRFKGRFAGNIYAIHGEPIPISDAALLDPDYLNFCESASRHGAKRTRLIAEAASATLDRLVASGEDPGGLMDGQGISAAFARRYHHGSQSVDDESLTEFQAQINADHQQKNLKPVEARRLKNFKSVENDQKSTTCNRLKNFKSVSSSSSSCSNIEKTTTTKDAENSRKNRPQEPSDSLLWPEEMTSSQRTLAAKHLKRFHGDTDLRQHILDEWWGNVRLAKQSRRSPIARPYGFLHALITAAHNGNFTLSDAGLSIEEERATLRKIECSSSEQLPPSDELIWPAGLSPQTRTRAMQLLHPTPEVLWQDLLDEWKATLGYDKDWPPNAALGMLQAFCRRAERGSYEMSVGARVVRQLRERKRD